MNRDDFISIDAIRFGLNGLEKNLRFFIVLAIIVSVLYHLPVLISKYFFKFQIPDGTHLTSDIFAGLLTVFVFIIIYLIVELGLLRIALKFKDNKAVEFKDLFGGYHLLPKYLLATIIFYLIITLPYYTVIFLSMLLGRETSEDYILLLAMLVSLAAAAYLHLKYQFFGYFIVDRGSGPIEALKQSGRMTKGVLKNLLIFWIEMGLVIGFVSAIASIVAGIVVEIPVAMILVPVSESLAAMASDFISSTVSLFVAVPLIKLATADIYRRLEWRSPRRTAPDLPGLQPAGEAGASEGV
ncbi:MAG: hypothetical protein PHW87_05855 [Methanothrix sp.]|nr:hypothetical protein [Methanothrix sp.]